MRIGRACSLKGNHNLQRRCQPLDSCLTSRSDILAELDLPRSNIDLPELQELVPKPKGIYAHRIVEDAETRVMMLYSSQILLRKTLNDIQEVLYQVKS